MAVKKTAPKTTPKLAAIRRNELARGVPAEPPVELWANIRRQQGTGCEQQAEIGAFYSGDITVVGVWGRAKLLQILNAAAAQLCCGKGVQCPKKCPCHYTPQKALGFYIVAGTREIGALLQGNQVWNCECLEVHG